MKIVDIAIKRPVFITCVFLFSIICGLVSFFKINVDQFPDVTFPVVLIATDYPGAGPEDIESLISKPVEEAVSSIGGIDSISSRSQDGQSIVTVAFLVGVDMKYAQQQVQNKISAIRNNLPSDLVQAPVVAIHDVNATAVSYLAVVANLKQTELYDLVDQKLRPLIENIYGVGDVIIHGGRKREIHVLLNRNTLQQDEISTSTVVNRLMHSGNNIPGGNFTLDGSNISIRTIGEYGSISQLSNVPILFYQNEVLKRIRDIGTVKDAMEDETSRSFLSGKRTLVVAVYKASDANTVNVTNAVGKFIKRANKEFENIDGFKVILAKDTSKKIRSNLFDVGESIVLGLILTIIGVYLFLGNIRSTLITAMALPNSLICAFLIMYISGFTINIMTLLAMSLSVGLLIDDAIIVRENIFRYIELGKKPIDAASLGTKEIILAVIATTLAIVGVFLPIAFLDGMVGQFFKQFGLTVCFIMLISLLDALAMAPMLSAYFGGVSTEKKGLFGVLDFHMQKISGAIQNAMINRYEKILKFTVKHYNFILLIAFVFTVIGFFLVRFIPKTFIKSPDNGDFVVFIEMEPGTALDSTHKVAQEIDEQIRKRNDVDFTILITGGDTIANSNIANITVQLVPRAKRKLTTTEIRSQVRGMISEYKSIKSFGVTDADNIGGGSLSPKNTGAFALDIMGDDLGALYKVSQVLVDKLKDHPDLQDLDISYRPGGPEIKIKTDLSKASAFGITPQSIGNEIRTYVQGTVAGTFKQNGYDYDIRVRLREDQRDINKDFAKIAVPNINNKMVNITKFAEKEHSASSPTIYRIDRMRYVGITASSNPDGKGGLNKAMKDTEEILKEEIKKYPGIKYKFDSQAKRFQELGISIASAMGLALVFMYLVLASLYESFRQPLLVMSILPLALCGGFYALFIFGGSLDLFSMIGCVMLIGIAAKNSILLVDRFNQLRAQGIEYVEAVIEAGKLRIRPIIMTSIVLIAGMMPIAIGLNEASQQRTSMGIVIVGGLISSTLLTLVVLPAIYMVIYRIKNRTSLKTNR